MVHFTPIPLTPIPVDLNSCEFAAISDWPYADAFVGRLLREDIPQRVQFGDGRMWVYRDPADRLVGFGTIDVCEDYRDYTAGRHHPYIPLLAVNPTIPSLGYGTSILRHLIDEAALLACRSAGCCDRLFLDVYTTSEKAIELYKRSGFISLTDTPIPDHQEAGKSYIVMAQRVFIAPA